jgi:hypothetical protein
MDSDAAACYLFLLPTYLYHKMLSVNTPFVHKLICMLLPLSSVVFRMLQIFHFKLHNCVQFQNINSNSRACVNIPPN